MLIKYSVPHSVCTQSLRPEVLRLRTAVDMATSSREQYVDKFCHHLDKDITELGKDVKDIKNQGVVRLDQFTHWVQ